MAISPARHSAKKRKAPVFTEAQHRPEISNPLENYIGTGAPIVNRAASLRDISGQD